MKKTNSNRRTANERHNIPVVILPEASSPVPVHIAIHGPAKLIPFERLEDVLLMLFPIALPPRPTALDCRCQRVMLETEAD